jgi:peptidyl-prolyl cis-trans isomerase C
LAELIADSSCFAEHASSLSNCASGALGGSLGQFGRGEMVPEFDWALFGKPDVGSCLSW